MPRRRKTILPAGFSMLVTAAKAAKSIPANDRELLVLVAELRAAVDAFNAGLYGSVVPGKAGNRDQLEQAAYNHTVRLEDRLASIPASGFAGVAAKVAWLCESQMQSGTADAALMESIWADLERHQPQAVEPVVSESSGPDMQADHWHTGKWAN
jgi:hypothetical protein